MIENHFQMKISDFVKIRLAVTSLDLELKSIGENGVCIR